MNKTSILIFLLISLNTFTSYAINIKPKVAIIGAGIGGASLSFYLSELGLEAEIFEKTDRVGGRVKSYYVEDLDPNDSSKRIKAYYEIGATVWAKPCYYIDNLAKILNVSVIHFDDDDKMEYYVWQGNGSYLFDLKSISNNNLILMNEMLIFKQSLAENYITRDSKSVANDLKHSTPFNSIDEFSKIGDLNVFTNISTYDYFIQKGVDHEFIKLYIDPIIRVIYEQNSEEVNAFAGLTSLISGQDARSASIGLQNFIHKMIETSGYPVHLNSKVEEIRKIGNKYELVIQQGNEKVTKEFEFVVISTPINYASIKFTNFDNMNFHYLFDNKEEYVKKTVTFVKAKELNEKFFGFKADAILTSKISDMNNVPFYSITIDYTFSNGYKLYSIFSKEPVPYKQYFVDPELIHIENWEYTFPHLLSKKSYQPIEPSENLFYVNSIEKIAVAMEASVLLSRNIALIIKSRINSQNLSLMELSHVEQYLELTYPVLSLLFGMVLMNFLLKIGMSKPTCYQSFRNTYRVFFYLSYISLYIEGLIFYHVLQINIPQETTYVIGTELLYIILLVISRYCRILHPFSIISDLIIYHDMSVLIGVMLGATFSYWFKDPLNLILNSLSFGLGGLDITCIQSHILFVILLFLTIIRVKKGVKHSVSTITTTVLIVLNFILFILTVDIPYTYKTPHHYLFAFSKLALPHDLFNLPAVHLTSGAIIASILMNFQSRAYTSRILQRRADQNVIDYKKIIGTTATVFAIVSLYPRSPLALFLSILLI